MLMRFRDVLQNADPKNVGPLSKDAGLTHLRCSVNSTPSTVNQTNNQWIIWLLNNQLDEPKTV